MTPSQAIVARAAETLVTKDRVGKTISLRRPTALDTLRLLKAAGPALAQNQPWLEMAMLAFVVMEIDEVPCPPPTTEAQIEALVKRLGEDGLASVADCLSDTAEGNLDTVGNSPGTPI